MVGIDISAYQKGIDLSKGNYDFAIIKATEGTGYISKTFNDFAVQLTKLDKLIGCYHFARPDLNGSLEGMEREAKFFIETVESAGLLYNSILVLDWEKEPMDREDLITAWVKKVMDLTGVVPFIYGSKSKFKKWQNYRPVVNCPLWMAAWPSKRPREVGDIYGLDVNNITIVGALPWHIWQYSANGVFPGFNGTVDLDYTNLSEEQWKWWCCDQRVKEHITADMEWAIDNKLFVGDGNGHYNPQEPLTREQAASLFKRFYDMIMEEL